MFDIIQGNILKTEGQKFPVLVVSKDFFNRTGKAIVCPILAVSTEDPLHIQINTGEIQGVVLCEQMKLLDLSVRGHKKVSELKIADMMNIVDAIQGIFDYYPYNRQ